MNALIRWRLIVGAECTDTNFDLRLWEGACDGQCLCLQPTPHPHFKSFQSPTLESELSSAPWMAAKLRVFRHFIGNAFIDLFFFLHKSRVISSSSPSSASSSALSYIIFILVRLFCGCSHSGVFVRVCLDHLAEVNMLNVWQPWLERHMQLSLIDPAFQWRLPGSSRFASAPLISASAALWASLPAAMKANTIAEKNKEVPLHFAFSGFLRAALPSVCSPDRLEWLHL